jgi:lysophospholipase L1-like esterase
MPVAGGIASVLEKARNLRRLIRGHSEEDEQLLRQILLRLESSVESNGARLLVMVLPDQETAYPGGWRRYLPDHYARVLSVLDSAGLEYFDARSALWAADASPWDVFADDYFHFDPEGNRIIAEALKDRLAAPPDSSVIPSGAG